MDSERENEMKISNFKETRRDGDGVLGGRVFATVDITTGAWIWRRTVTREICKEHSTWFFTDTGEFTPEWDVEALARAYYARKGE